MDSTSTSSPAMSEQADLIAQLVKYSDRLIVVQSPDPEERSSFIRQVAERLPDDVHVFTHEATAESQLQDLIGDLADRLQLSPGIEAPRQLVTAIHEAFTGNTRALAVIEDIENWYESDNWGALVELIRVTHEMNSRHLLFLLTGQADLEERLLATPDLGDMQGDIHTVTLSAMPTENSAADDIETQGDTVIPSRRRSQRRFNPTLLIVAAISVLIVTVGGFALLSRSHKEAKPVTQTLAIPNKPATVTAPSTPAEPQTPAPAATAANPPKLAQLQTPSTPAPEQQGQTASGAEENAMPSAKSNAPETGEVAAAPSAAPAPTESSAQPQLPASSVAPKPESKTKSQVARTAEQPAPKVKPATEPKAPPKKVTAKTTSKTPSGAENHWYQQKPRARGVVQLGAFNDLASARAFIKHHEGKTAEHSWHIFTQKPKEQLLYTVTLGDFSSVQRARHAIKSLPGDLRKLKPYPRSIGSVQDAIKH